MRTTGSLFKQAIVSGLCAALAVSGALPASARDHNRTAAQRQTVRQDPVRTAPRRETFVRTAPRRETFVRTAPRRETFVRTAPRRETFVRTAPRRETFVRTAPRRETFVRTAPRRETFVRTAPRRETFVRTAPRRETFVRTAPRRETFVRTAPRTTFVRTIQPRHIVRSSPFIQYVRVAPRRERFVTTREIVRSPLMRSIVAPRVRTVVAYHPAYLAGRVVSLSRDRIVLDPPVGQPIIVRDFAVANPSAFVPVGSFVTLPVQYANGYYQVYSQPTYNGYSYAPPAYCYGPSSTLYAALLPAVIGALTGNGSSSFNSSDLASLALAAAGNSNSCSAYEPAYATPVTYAQPVAYAPAPYTVSPYGYANTYSYPNAYTTPYDNCVWSDMDNDGDGGCAAPQQTAFAYSPYGAYAPQQVQGLVVAKSGTTLMVLDANGTQPIFVNAAPAFENGAAFNGPVAIGQVIDAIGYYNGNTFVATALE